MSKRQKEISLDEAVVDIIGFVEKGNDFDADDGDDLEDLYGAELEPDEEFEDDTEDMDEEEEKISLKWRRKMLTYQRKVHNINSVFDENNYMAVSPATVERVIVGNLNLPTTKKANPEQITFTNVPPRKLGRQRSCDVIKGKPGVTRQAEHAKSPKERFDLLITPAMVDDIVKYTNLRIRRTIQAFPAQKRETGKYPYLKEVDAVEIYGFIGLMYIRGLYNWDNHSLGILFSEEKGMPIFGATMSRLRFSFIVQHFCFDVEETLGTRWQSDRFAALRDLFEACSKNFAAALVPEDYLMIDETLYPMRNQIAFKEYNPDKPAKYELLFKSINCAR